MPGVDKELRRKNAEGILRPRSAKRFFGKKALGLEPLVMLGKNGLDTAQLEELKTQLKRKKLIKVRMQ